MPYSDPVKQRQFQVEWIKRRREAWLQENGPCSRCGFWGELEIDHIDPEDKSDHRVWSWTEARRVRELMKCQVLCRFCHSIKTATENRIRFAVTQVDPQVYLEWRASITMEAAKRHA